MIALCPNCHAIKARGRTREGYGCRCWKKRRDGVQQPLETKPTLLITERLAHD
jgi:hypothetical protein